MKRVRALLAPLLIRFTGLSIMGYVIVYLLLAGGAESVGAFSAVSAITAPGIMFLMFRYVESLATSHNRSLDFTLHVLIAVLGYGALLPVIWVLVSMLAIDPIVALLLLAFKFFEIISDLLITMFVTTGQGRHAQLSSLARLVGVITISCVAYRFFCVEPLLVVSTALLVTYASVILFFDLPRALAGQFFARSTVAGGWRFLKANVKYGMFGVINSAGSSLPRLFLGFVGGLSALGVFSVLYQVAATAVNVLQYPISINAPTIGRFVRTWRVLEAMLLVVLGGAGLLTLLSHMDAVSGSSDALTLPVLGAYGLIAVLMFSALLLRGVAVSAAIALGVSGTIHFIALVSIVIGAMISIPIALAAGDSESQLYTAVVFVVVSCCAATWLLLRRIKAWV